MLNQRLPWLDPSEQEEMVACLLEHQLIKFSNGRDLPLKSGGKTDIYVALRDAPFLFCFITPHSLIRANERMRKRDKQRKRSK